MSPWERPFPVVLGWEHAPCRAGLSAFHKDLPLPTWAVGILLHPCMPHPPLPMGLQAEHTQVFVGKAQSPLPSLFLKWFILTQTEILEYSASLPLHCPVSVFQPNLQPTGSNTANCRTPNPLKSHQKIMSKKFTYKFHREFPISIS